MTYEIRLRLTTPFLGQEKPDARGIRTITRDGGGLVVLDPGTWYLNLEIARYNLKLKGNFRESVECPSRMLPAQSSIFRRTFGASRSELFEIYRVGTCLTLPFVVRDQLPDAPSEETLCQLLGWIGFHLGCSQFGSKFGYGRFHLLPALQF